MKMMRDTGDVEDKNRNFVTALARGLELLRAFGADDRYLGNRELSERTGIPRPTVSRLTHTLTRLGYLRYSERHEKYQLDAGVLAFGYRHVASAGIRDLARPSMQALADATACTVAMGTPDATGMTYVEVCQGAGPLILRLDVGSRIPLATSAMGRAYLAGLSESRRAQCLDSLRAADPAGWTEAGGGIERAIRDFEEKGFCVSEGEWNRDIAGVGVPLVLEGGARVLPFNCGGAAFNLTRRVLEENLGPRLVDLVRRVERQVMGR